MLSLAQRLAGIIEILTESNHELERDHAAEGTGFLSFNPKLLAEAVEKLLSLKAPPALSLDLGSGNGSWTLLAAAAGYTSYGIEINSYLVEKANENYRKCVERNLIDQNTPCKFITANIYPIQEKERFLKFAALHTENPTSMPWEDTQDPYRMLGVNLRDADIVYCWSWPTESRFLYNFLAREADEKTIFVLPSYIVYTQGEHMNESMREQNELFLTPLVQPKNSFDIFIGQSLEKRGDKKIGGEPYSVASRP